MATARDNPTLKIDIEYDEQQARRAAEQHFRQEDRRLQTHNNRIRQLQEQSEAQVIALKQRAAAQAAAKRQQIEAAAQARLAAQALTATQRQENAISLMRARELERRRIADERAQQRMLAGHTTWSQKMVSGINSVSMALKGMAAAWAISKVTEIFSGSLEFVSELRNQADALDLTVSQFFSIRSAAASAGIPAEKLLQVFTKLKILTEGGATPAQNEALGRAGIQAVGMETIDLFDLLLQRTAQSKISLTDVAELIDRRSAITFKLLASQINSVNDALTTFSGSISQEEADKIETFTSQMQHLTDRMKVNVATAAVWLSNTRNLMVVAPQWLTPYIKLWEILNEREERSIRNQQRLNDLIAQARGDIDSRRAASNVPAPLPFGPFMTPEDEAYNLRIAAREHAARRAELLDRNRPVDSSGRALRRPARAQIDRSFDLPTITKNLPVIVRTTEQWARSNEVVVTTAEILQMRFQQISAEYQKLLPTIQATEQFAQSLFSLQAVYTQNQITAIDAVSERERQRWFERSEMLRASGLETSALYRNELRAFQDAEKKREAQAKGLKSKAFEQDKAGRIVSTTMFTAQSVMNAWATLPWPFSLIVSALATATGAAQIATIQAQQNPYNFREGGWVRGSLQDNNRVNATGGEFISTRETAARNREALEYMRAGGTLSPRGGDVTVYVQGNIVQNNDWLEDTLIPAIIKAQRRGVRVSR